MSYKFLCSLSFLSFTFYFTSAQNLRNANDAEKAVIAKAVHIILPLIDGFQNSTWQKEEGGADEPQDYTVGTHPDVVMGTAPFNDWHFTIRVGSDFYDKNIKPYYDKLNSGNINANDTKAMETLVKEGQEIKLESHLYVEVHVNEAGLPVKPVKNSPADLKIPGCYFSYKQRPDLLIGTDRNIPDSYVLVFGNWATAKLVPGIQEYDFKYTHPLGSPFIENIVIIISGPPGRLQEILKTTDWEQVNGALTN